MDSGKQLATRFLGKGEICRRLKPLLGFFSCLSTHPIPIPIPYYLLLTAGNTIPSSSPNPTLLPKTVRNPRETRTRHTLKFPSDQIPTGAQPASHTCDRHAANLLRFVHGLIGFRDGGISFRCTTCTECGCGRYTIPVILYYTLYLYLYLHLHSTHSLVCLMYKVYNGERKYGEESKSINLRTS